MIDVLALKSVVLHRHDGMQLRKETRSVPGSHTTDDTTLPPEYCENLAQHPALTRLVLTGFMGCGKSTLGRKLAERLHFNFIDLDTFVENKQKKRIADIFTQEGEAAFRAYEQDALNTVLGWQHYVIATGGGALVQQDNLNAALDASVVIYLQIDTEDLLERILFSPKERPLMDVPDPQQVLDAMFNVRAPFYEQAQVHVNTMGLKPDEATEAVLKGLHNYVTYFLPNLNA
jgi:shikimate kinase